MRTLEADTGSMEAAGGRLTPQIQLCSRIFKVFIRKRLKRTLFFRISNGSFRNIDSQNRMDHEEYILSLKRFCILGYHIELIKGYNIGIFFVFSALEGRFVSVLSAELFSSQPLLPEDLESGRYLVVIVR